MYSITDIERRFAASQERSQLRRNKAATYQQRRGMIALLLMCLLGIGMFWSEDTHPAEPVGGVQAIDTSLPAAGGAKYDQAPLTPVPQTANGPQVTAETWVTVQLPFGAQITAEARAQKLDVLLLAALVKQESRFDPDAVSHAGAMGLTQLMPQTARSMGVTDAHDPEQALRGGARYLAMQLRAFGKVSLALAAYNAGPGAVKRHRGIPPFAETRTYVRRILNYRREFRTQLAQERQKQSGPVQAGGRAA